MVDHSIKGKTVLIAGGAKNLGGLIARDLAEHGAKAIAIHYHSAASKPEADATVAAVKAAGAQAEAFQADLTQPGAVAKLFANAKTAFGAPDIAINTVGKVLKKPIADTTDEEFDAMFAINTKVAYQFIREAGKHLADNGKLLTLVTSLLGLTRRSIPPMRVPRLRWSTSPVQPPRNMVHVAFRLTPLAPAPWIRRSFTGRKAQMPWLTIKPLRHFLPLAKLA